MPSDFAVPSVAESQLSERKVRHWVSYWLGNHSEAKIDAMVETMPDDAAIARWINEKMGWSYGRR